MKFFQDLCLRSLFVLGYVRMKSSAHGRTFLRFFEEKYQKKKPQGTPERGGFLTYPPRLGHLRTGRRKFFMPTKCTGTTRLARYALHGGGSFCLRVLRFYPHGQLLFQMDF